MSDKPISILLIEDNLVDAELLGEFLADEVIDFDLVHTLRLQDGIDRLNQCEFDIVLLDLSLPDGEGMSVVDQVRTQKDSPPIVILTGREDEDLALEILQKGIQDYLPKGRLNGEILVRSIRYAIERRQSELKIRQSQRMEAIGQLAGGVAHDFNNLLTVILGYSELALGDLDTRETVKSALEEVQKAGESASALTRQLLAFSRTSVWSPQSLDINQLLKDMQKMLMRVISKSVNIDFQLAPDLEAVRADRGQIEQIVLNLAINGRDAMPTGGTLTLSTQQIDLESTSEIPLSPGNYIQVCVSDTGTGIAPELVGRIFDPFFTTKESGKGTGLGLSTVHGIVEEMDGYIDVYSNVGEGSTFSVFLPVCQEFESRQDTVSTAQQAKEYTPLTQKTIMVVDDDPNICEMLSTILTKNGFEIVASSKPQEAISVFKERGREIDLLLTDIVMPGINGVELYRQLASMRPDLPVLFMSGYSMGMLTEQQIEMPELHILQKPFTPSRLIETIEELVSELM